MYTKYEVSMSNPVPGEGVHRHQHRRQRRTIVKGSLVDKPNEPKSFQHLLYILEQTSRTD